MINNYWKLLTFISKTSKSLLISFQAKNSPYQNMQDLLKIFLERFPEGKINEPLARYTTLKLGGPATLFYNLESPEALPALLTFVKENQIP
jgi:hypothetical protein